MKNRLFVMVFLAFLLLTGSVNLSAAAPQEEESTNVLTGILNMLSAFSVEFIKNQRYEVETGLINTGYNDVRVPGEGGSLFSMKDDLKAKQAFHFRFRLTQPLAAKHRLIFMYAPLKVKSSGRIDREYAEEFFEFQDMQVPADLVPSIDFDGEYRLDTYRQTYLFDLLTLKNTVLSAGASVEIRDEAIKIYSADRYGRKTDTNVVFSVNFRALTNLNEKLALVANGNVLIDSKNRAEDIFLGASYKILKDSRLNVGYRLIERKTDKPEIYNSAMFHLLTVGIDLNP
ncbi:MAG: hypothetical protein R6V77_05405 [Candidatus Cloacimonadaceae bacterium]